MQHLLHDHDCGCPRGVGHSLSADTSVMKAAMLPPQQGCNVRRPMCTEGSKCIAHISRPSLNSAHKLRQDAIFFAVSDCTVTLLHRRIEAAADANAAIAAAATCLCSVAFTARDLCVCFTMKHERYSLQLSHLLTQCASFFCCCLVNRPLQNCSCRRAEMEARLMQTRPLLPSFHHHCNVITFCTIALQRSSASSDIFPACPNSACLCALTAELLLRTRADEGGG